MTMTLEYYVPGITTHLGQEEHLKSSLQIKQDSKTHSYVKISTYLCTLGTESIDSIHSDTTTGELLLTQIDKDLELQTATKLVLRYFHKKL